MNFNSPNIDAIIRYAVDNRQDEVLQMLIKHEVGFKDKTLMHILLNYFMTSWQFDNIKSFIQIKDHHPIIAELLTQQPIIEFAVALGNIDEIKYLLDLEGVIKKPATHTKVTVLDLAIAENNVPVIQLLIDKGFAHDVKPYISMAMMSQFEKATMLTLIENGLNTDMMDRQGLCSLNYAMNLKFEFDIIAALMKVGAKYCQMDDEKIEYKSKSEQYMNEYLHIGNILWMDNHRAELLEIGIDIATDYGYILLDMTTDIMQHMLRNKTKAHGIGGKYMITDHSTEGYGATEETETVIDFLPNI